MIVTAPVTSSRERFLASLCHQQPSGIPIDCGGTAVTGIHATCVAALRDYYGLESWQFTPEVFSP